MGDYVFLVIIFQKGYWNVGVDGEGFGSYVLEGFIERMERVLNQENGSWGGDDKVLV